MDLLKISKNGRFISKNGDTPFFWLADTAWELFHKLDREEAELYLNSRSERKFNVIQAVALAENDGIRTGNAYGRKPFLENSQGEYDPTLPDLSSGGAEDQYDYWKHVDFVVEKAGELGMFIGFLPTWGDKFNEKYGKGPEVFNVSNARIYGRWLGARYKNNPNIIWIMGGDRPLETAKHFEVVRAMAEGIKEGDEGKHIMTLHPVGRSASSYAVHDEKWLDFNMIQTGHCNVDREVYTYVEKDYGMVPVKPTVNGEPLYEDHPIDFKPENGYFNDADVRRSAYWSVFSGAMGHTYGHHCIWYMNKDQGKEYFAMHWKKAILRPGASQMQHLRTLMESKPYFERVPDQGLIAENYIGLNHLQATAGKSYAFIYSPNGLTMKVNMGRISGSTVKASWFNPKDGTTQFIDKFDNNGTIEFTPPSSGSGNDWVLILEDGEII